MKKDNLLELLKLINTDEFIKKNIKYLFPNGKKIDLNLFLNLSDTDILNVLALGTSKQKFIQLYYVINGKYYVNSDTNEKILKFVPKNINAQLEDILIDLIIGSYDSEFHNINSSVVGDIIYNISISKGLEQARSASILAERYMKSNVEKEIRSEYLYLIKKLSSLDHDYQARYILEYLSPYDKYFHRCYSDDILVCDVIASTENEMVCRYIMDVVRTHYLGMYGSKLIEILSKSKGVLQAKCAADLIKHWEFNFQNYKTTSKFDNRLEYVRVVSEAAGGVQALKARDIYMDDNLLSSGTYFSMSKIAEMIANMDKDYQAGYALLVLKYLANEEPMLISSVIKIISETTGPIQTEYASYLAVDKKVLCSKNGLKLISMVGSAVGEKQAEFAYLVIKRLPVLDEDGILDIIEAITNMDDKACILIKNDIWDYIEQLPSSVCISIINGRNSENKKAGISINDMMEIEDLGLLIGVLDGLEEEEITDKTMIPVNTLARKLRDRKKN